MEELFPIGLTLVLLILAYVVGSALERRHYVDIRQREAELGSFPLITFETLPQGWRVASATVVDGSVVVSVDYFKRFLAGLRGLVGGPIRSYEPLLDRGRREAVLRMAEAARSRGFDAVINVRLETSRLASARGNGQGTSGVEMLAYGTAVRLER